MSTPKRLITVVVVLAGVLSSIASDAGYVVLIPLGAIIFLSMGRHPLAGLAAAFAGVSGGFSANVMVGPTDSLLAGLTTEGAKLVDPNYVVGIQANWWFLIASTVLITIIGTVITEKIVEPRLGKYTGDAKVEDHEMKVSTEEQRGFCWNCDTVNDYIICCISCSSEWFLTRNGSRSSRGFKFSIYEFNGCCDCVSICSGRNRLWIWS